MITSIIDILQDLAQHFWDWYLHIYALPPLAALLIMTVLGFLIWSTYRYPGQTAAGFTVLVAAFVLAMPAGMDNARLTWEQSGVDAKYTCVQELAGDIDYWTGASNTALLCR
jgi:hypothetical protein